MPMRTAWDCPHVPHFSAYRTIILEPLQRCCPLKWGRAALIARLVISCPAAVRVGLGSSLADANGRNRRILVIGGHPGKSPLTEPTAAACPRQRGPQPVLVEFRGPRVRLLRVFRVFRCIDDDQKHHSL